MLAAQAQTGSNISLLKKLQLPAGKIRLDSLSQLVAKQTQFRFSINSSKIKATTLIDIPAANINIDNLLKQLKKQFGVPYSISGNHIILSDRIVEKEIATPVKKQTVAAASPKINSRIAHTEPVLVRHPLPIVNTQLSVTNRDITMAARRKNLPTHPGIYDGRARTFNLPALYAHIGVSADDVMYSNVFAAFGKPWLYATGSWGTQFGVQGFRYGLGSGIDLSDTWLLRIELSTGKFQKGFDTTGFKTSVKSKLHRAGFLIEKNLSAHFCIHGGLLLNWLQTKFYMNGERTSANRLVPWSGENDSRYINIKPLYTISNTFSPGADSYRQTWVGLQVGVIYRLNF